MKKMPQFLAVICSLTVAAAPAFAVPVTIANSGFEADVVALNGVAVTTPVSWTSTPLIAAGGSIIDYVIDGNWYSPAGFTSPHSGNQYYLGGATTTTPFTFNILSQDTPLLWSQLSVGDTLTVSVWAAWAGTTGGSPYTAFWLNYSDAAGINSPFFDVSATRPGGLLPGQWIKLVWNYTVTQTAIDAANANSWGAVNLGIGFAGPDNNAQIGFDDVNMEHIPVPEPGSIAITNSGFEQDNVPDNGSLGGPAGIPIGWTWQPFVGPGIAPYLIDKAFLGGTPHAAGIVGAHSGDQYFMGHAGGAAAVPLIHQDTALPWSSLSPGDTLTFSVWATYRSDYPGNNAVTLWLNFWDDIALGVDTTINSINFNVSSTGASAPGEWTQYVWNHLVTQAEIDEAAAEGWGNVNVQISFYGSEGSQVSFDDVSLVWTQGPFALAKVSPPDNASGVPVASNLVATFTRGVALTGSGSIALKNLSGGADIPITLPGGVSIYGKLLTINPPSNLVAGQQYAVEISADAIEDLSDPAESYAGLLATDTPNWSFTASPAGAHVKVFLLGGQSNAVGLGKTSGLPTTPVNLSLPQHDVLLYANFLAGGLTTLRPGSGVDFGPELSYGRAVANASPGTTYAIIKHAEGGTGLWDDWFKDVNPASSPSYVNFRNTVAAGLAALNGAGYTTEIVGMVWHQGESDAIENKEASYQARLTNFIADIRNRYGANLPFLIGEILHLDSRFVTVTTAQQAVAVADPFAVFVPASDLPVPPDDNIHFTTAGQITLGERFAVGYATLVPPGGDFADWISNPAFGIDPGKRGWNDDPDGDGLGNGVENYFGTNPGTFSQGIVAGVKSENTFTFTHPISGTPASDLTAAYRWSKDLWTFTPGGVAFEGSTVTFAPGTPSGGFVTVTATATGTALEKLFVDVKVGTE